MPVPAAPGEKGVLDIRLIRPGRREHRAIGDIRPLADSIRTAGLRHPVTISPRYGLITGRRRLAACEHLGRTDIPYRVIGTVAEALDVIAEEDADPRQALPMTIAEVIYRDWQMRDELQWWPRAGHNRADPSARYEHREMLARAAGLNSSAYTNAYAIILAAEGYRRSMNYLQALEDEDHIAAAREAAKMLETADQSAIGRAYRHYRKGFPAAAPLPPVTATHVDAALARLTGTAAAFIGGITLPPDASPDLLQHWDDILTMQVLRPLVNFRRTQIRKGAPQ